VRPVRSCGFSVVVMVMLLRLVVPVADDLAATRGVA
jgi:hypothetical protein